MSEEQQESSRQTVTERSALQAGVDWVAKQWPRVRLGHEGMMLNKIERQNRCVEVVARNTMTGKMGDTAGLPINEEGDAMGVRIGDEIVNHYYPQPPSQSDPGPKPEPKPEFPTWKRLLVGAALAGLLGGSIGLGAAELWRRASQPEQPPAVVDTDTDTYTQIEAVQIYQPEIEP